MEGRPLLENEKWPDRILPYTGTVCVTTVVKLPEKMMQ